MKKIFSLFLAVACCLMAFGQIISVTDGTLADWDNVPSDYLFKTECAPNASMNGLKSVQVYVDLTNINLLVEVNDDVITDREWTIFHVYINSDNNSSTGGYGDQWVTADVDLMFETAIFASGAVYPYNPGVFKWWGANGENGWLWTDPEVDASPENGWGALVPEGSLPIGNSQMVEDGKIEIQLNYTLIPFPFDETTFTLGFDIQQSWTSAGILPNAHDDENGRDVLAEKLRVNVHQQNKSGNVTINDIQYRITSDVEPYTAEVFSLFNKDVNEIVIPETIVVDGITYSVTSIGANAFFGCSSLTSITIPSGVTNIGEYAFSGCSSLASINIPNGVTNIGDYAFSDCSSLTSITIPNGVTSIGEQAFYSCSSLAAITIPSSVKSIGDHAFYGCSSLASITIPNSVTSIGDDAFSSCSSLASITIPNSVTSIGSGAFYRCSGLISMVVESGNTKYDSRNNCNAIIETATNTLMAGCKNTIIPNSITSIGSSAFNGCSSLAAITIPNSVTSIGANAFSGCSSLAAITIPNSVTSIGENAFSSCSSLTAIAIPEGVTSIEWGTFSRCTSLTSVTIPSSVKSIGSSAFFGCSSLASFTIPEGITRIESSTFAQCSSLTTITIPKSVEWIAYWTFDLCYNLTTVICHAVVVPSLDSRIFDAVPTSSAVLYVPAESIDDYKAADQWKDFGTILPLEEAPSAVDNVEASTGGIQKFLRNGQVIIIHDGVEYTIMGQEL